MRRNNRRCPDGRGPKDEDRRGTGVESGRREKERHERREKKKGGGGGEMGEEFTRVGKGSKTFDNTNTEGFKTEVTFGEDV